VWDAFGYLLTTLLLLVSIFLILLILVQRGKGGGLVGALGGMGGQSAFGAKAGGIFWATSVAAGVWIFLCIAAVMYNSSGQKVFAGASGVNAGELQGTDSTIEAEPGTTAPATTGGATTPSDSGATGASAPTATGEVTEKDFAEEAPAGDAEKSK
jgi:preprotein translocase subunit SecG